MQLLTGLGVLEIITLLYFCSLLVEKSSARWYDLRKTDCFHSSYKYWWSKARHTHNALWLNNKGGRWNWRLCAQLPAKAKLGYWAIHTKGPNDIIGVDILGDVGLENSTVYTSSERWKGNLSPALRQGKWDTVEVCGQITSGESKWRRHTIYGVACSRTGVRWVIVRPPDATAGNTRLCEIGVREPGWMDFKGKEYLTSSNYLVDKRKVIRDSRLLADGDWSPGQDPTTTCSYLKGKGYFAVNLGDPTDITDVALMARFYRGWHIDNAQILTGGDMSAEEVKQLLESEDFNSFEVCVEKVKHAKRSKFQRWPCEKPSVKWIIMRLTKSGGVCEMSVKTGEFDECAHGFCKNNATCTDLRIGYTCECQEGWEGKTCKQDINECASTPCQLQGTCIDYVAGYKCVCPPGSTGSHCQTDINECESSPCINPGVCVDALNSYTCNCPSTLTGVHCEQDVPEQSSIETSLSLDKEFEEALQDPESEEYKTLFNDVGEFMLDQCEKAYPQHNCEMLALRFSPGSTNVDAEIGVTPNSKQPSSMSQNPSQTSSQTGNSSSAYVPPPAMGAEDEAGDIDGDAFAKQMGQEAEELEKKTGAKVDKNSMRAEARNFGEKVIIEPKVSYIMMGCFAFVDDQFTPQMQQLPFTTETSDKAWTNKTCGDLCRELHTYTYAGIHAFDRMKCKCFNGIDMLRFINGTDKTGCLNVARENHFNHLEVYTTCPANYYNPPMCNIRAKPTCLESSHHAVALFDGTCENCKQLKGETGWEGCHHISHQAASNIIDFRYMEPALPMSPLTQNSMKETSTPTRSIGLTLSAIRPKNFYPDDTVHVFVHRINAMLMAQGACYFSTWTREEARKVSLVDKLFLNTDKQYDLVDFHNVNMYLDDPDNKDLGVHVIDHKKALGADTSQLEYQGIVMQSFSDSQSLDLDYLGSSSFIPSMSNSDVKDNYQGDSAWVRGEVVTVTACGGTENCSPENRMFNRIGLVAYLVNTCPENCDGDECDEDLKCVHGCKSGFFGEYCGNPCTTDFLGPNCDTKCSYGCKAPGGCDSVTGICKAGCASGWSGIFCDIPCPDGWYGPDCNTACSKHCANYTCSMRTGWCDGGCKLGYQPKLCDVTCNNGNWGHQCQEPCGNCSEGEPCNPFTGLCENGCLEGFRPDDCTCSNKLWGRGCDKDCGSCKDGQVCDARTGYCPMEEGMSWDDPTQICDNYTQPPMCNCKYGRYGMDCDKRCGNCINEFCDDTNGKCILGCVPGFIGENCNTSCPAGWYGQDCLCSCPRCEQTCYNTNGSCPDDKCQKNFQPPECRHCVSHFFGDNCDSSCGGCKNNKPCHRNGTCPVDPDMDFWDFMPPDTTNGDVPNSEEDGEDGSNNSNRNETEGNNSEKANMTESPLFCRRGMPASMTSKPNCKQLQKMRLEGFKLTYDQSLELIRCGALSYKPITEEEHKNIKAAVNSICETGLQGPTCACKIDKWGENCDKDCEHCMAGCFSTDGVCIGGCAPGWVGPTCSKPCEKGFFGPNCRFESAHCVDDECHATNGTCKKDCQAGYMPPYCKCPLGFFGDECEQECGFCEALTCSFFDGKCPKEEGCQEPYHGPYCNCTSGMYGINCDGQCGRCANNEQCNYHNGVCENGCMAGYTGDKCTEKCPRGFWGHLCTKPCGKCRTCAACDPVDGSCPGQCEMGYMPPRCNSWCNATFYGEDCKKSCGNCFGDRPCDHEDGFCDNGCAPGYKPPDCYQTCDSGKYGYSCQYDCGECLNDATCDPFSGKCDQCKKHYKGDKCDVYAPPRDTETVQCDEFWYDPPKCDKECGHCINNMACNKVHGLCEGGCAPGYRTGYCNKECDDNYWGPGCGESCGHCKGNQPCRKSDGQCTNGCAAGYSGDTCKNAVGNQAARKRGEWSPVSSAASGPSLRLHIYLCICTLASLFMIYY